MTLNWRSLQELREVLGHKMPMLFKKNTLFEPSGEFVFFLNVLNRQNYDLVLPSDEALAKFSATYFPFPSYDFQTIICNHH